MQDDKVTSKPNIIRIRHRNAGVTRRKWMSMFLSVIFVCSLLAGCNGDDNTGERNSNIEINVVSEDISSSESIVIPEDIVVHTDYGDLHYPDRWQEYVTIRQEQNGSTIEVTFETESGGKTYELFRILIGGDGNEVIGSLTDNAGTQRNVYLYVKETAVSTDLDEAEQTRFYAMQEDLNYLIDNLK